MLKISRFRFAKLEKDYHGIVDDIMHFENMDLPPCPKCKSANTASVQGGIVGRTMLLAGATTKFKLNPNPPRSCRFFCNDCGSYFGSKSEIRKRSGASGGTLTMLPNESWEDFESRVVQNFTGQKTSSKNSSAASSEAKVVLTPQRGHKLVMDEMAKMHGNSTSFKINTAHKAWLVARKKAGETALCVMRCDVDVFETPRAHGIIVEPAIQQGEVTNDGQLFEYVRTHAKRDRVIIVGLGFNPIEKFVATMTVEAFCRHWKGD